MEAVGVIFGILLVGILGALLVDRSWIDKWMESKPEPFRVHTYNEWQAIIRTWPKPKREFHDQVKEWPDVFI